MVTVMKIIDLSHTIAKTTPVFPGSEKPQLATVASYEKDGYRETLIRMYSHTGTHIDPPAHVYEKGLTLDALPLTQFIGQAIVIDCRHVKPGELITMKEVNEAGEEVESATSFYSIPVGISFGELKNISVTIPASMMKFLISSCWENTKASASTSWELIRSQTLACIVTRSSSKTKKSSILRI